MARLFKHGEEVILTSSNTLRNTIVTYVSPDPILGKGYSIVRFNVEEDTYFRTFPDSKLSKMTSTDQQSSDYNRLFSDIKEQITDMQSQISQMYDKMEDIKSLLK